MSCEDLICAHCGGPVIEARCTVCRASKAHVHGTSGPVWSAAALAMMLMLLVVVVMLLEQTTR